MMARLLILILAALPTLSWAAPMEAAVKSVAGKVEYALPGGGKFQALNANQSLPMGATIRTGQDGTAIIIVVPGTAVRVESGSTLVLNEMDFAKSGGKITNRKAVLELKSGTVSALISKNDPKTTDFRIKTPQGVAAARGTFFGVTVQGDKAYVAVKEGKVGVKKEGEK